MVGPWDRIGPNPKIKKGCLEREVYGEGVRGSMSLLDQVESVTEVHVSGHGYMGVLYV